MFTAFMFFYVPGKMEKIIFWSNWIKDESPMVKKSILKIAYLPINDKVLKTGDVYLNHDFQ